MFSKKNKQEKQVVSQVTRKTSWQQTSTTQYRESRIFTTSTASISTNSLALEPTNFERNSLRSTIGNIPALAQTNRTQTDSYPFRPPNRPGPIYHNRISTVSTVPDIKNTSGIKSKEEKKSNAKKRIVKKSGKRYDDPSRRVPIYLTSSKGKRGRLLIINNKTFADKQYRKGAEYDEYSMKNVFKDMNFDVTVKSDLRRKDMLETLKNFSKKDYSKHDICVVAVMSHGRRNVGLTEILTIDGKTVDTEAIVGHFCTDVAHPSLYKKPKIFFFQCCRGDGQEEKKIDKDGEIVPSGREFADMLIAYSTVPGYASKRDPTSGTWYIQTICDVFSEFAHEFHVEDLLKKVDENLSNFSFYDSQTSSYECRGFKTCYFHP